jgi:hypothetical protein
LDPYQRVGGELDAGQLGETAEDWLHSRMLPSRLSGIETLRERWAPSKGAFSALTWLRSSAMYVKLDRLVPGCQWHVRQIPGVLPPVRDLILTEIVGPEAGTPVEATSWTQACSRTLG